MVKIGLGVFGVVLLATTAHAQTIVDTLATTASVVDIRVEYSCRETEQRGVIRYTPGVLPAAPAIQADAKTRLCAAISADYVDAAKTFEFPAGVDFPLHVDIIQKGIAGSVNEDTVMGTAEITCP